MKSKSRATPHRPAQSRASNQRASPVPRKWRWHYRALQRLRDHLVDDLCLKLAATADPLETHGMNPADSATDEFNRAITVCLLSGEKDSLREVNSAIHRILNGSYGICERTGKDIPKERLRAVPWTRFTREAENDSEKEGAIQSVKLAPVSSIQGPGSGAIGHAEEPEKQELQARVETRHGHARTLEDLGQGGRAVPGSGKSPPSNEKSATPPASRSTSGKRLAKGRHAAAKEGRGKKLT